MQHIRDSRAGTDESAPSSLGRVLALARAHPAGTDRVLTAVLAAASLAGLWLVSWSTRAHYRSPDIGGVLLTLAVVVPLAWRRQYPAPVLVVSGLALLAYDVAGYRSGLVWLAPLWAVYSYAVYRRRRNAYWPLAVWVAVILADLALPQYNTVQAAVVFLGATAFAWVRGDAVRSGLIEAKREREARARQAVADERARIARELHDVVSQALGVIVMQAGGAGTVPDLSEADAKVVLATIEHTGRQAFAEMRCLVGVLRDDDEAAALTPQPTVGEIPALVARLESAGLDVDLQVEGEQLPVPAGVGLSAYRIVQEALTNTLKHAGPARAQVRLVWSADRLDVEVSDDGPAAGADVPSRAHPGSGGNGLVGMRERVMLYGGELEAGPVAEGGYRVVAHLPLGGPA